MVVQRDAAEASAKIAEAFIIGNERDERDNARNATAKLIAAAIRAASSTSHEEADAAKLANLLTKAIGDIAAALILAGKADKIARWSKPYVEALNDYDTNSEVPVPFDQEGLVGWQPIESAPKDGWHTPILTCRAGDPVEWFGNEPVAGYAEPPSTAYWNDHADCWTPCQRPHDVWEPTHWMPLHAAPGEAAAGARS